jgi:glutamine amidotransferase
VIAVLDYGIGNLGSAEKALRKVGAEARLVEHPDDAEGAAGVVLPGVGAFGACLRALRESGLDSVVREAAASGEVPLLAICVGLQMLFEGSEEDPPALGLGILEGTVRRLGDGEKRPQMQWNRLVPVPERPSAMLGAAPSPAWVYFVHSYAAVPEGSAASAVVATCDYGGPVVAAVEQGNLWGCQFHPEKSGTTGLAILAAFATRCS